MKIRIIKEGLFGNPGLKVGMEFSLNGHPPAGWAGYYEVVSDDETKGKKAVTNPKKNAAIEAVDDGGVVRAKIGAIHPLDHDGDGKKGGSLPKAKKAEVKEGGAE